MYFLSIVNSFVRNKVYLLIYLLTLVEYRHVYREEDYFDLYFIMLEFYLPKISVLVDALITFKFTNFLIKK